MSYNANISDFLKEFIEFICIGNEVGSMLLDIILDFENGVPCAHELRL